MKKGFTLTEVMITLGIIAVVSALTFPTLMANYRKTVYVSQLHKVYNIFMNGFMLEMQNSTSTNLIEALRGENKYDVAGKFLAKNFQISKNCAYTVSTCFAEEYKNLSGSLTMRTEEKRNNQGFYGVVLNDGVSIAMVLIDPYGSLNDYMGVIDVDVNGPKAPNVVGRDFFRFYIWSDGTIDDYYASPNCRKNNECHDAANIQAQRDYNFDNYCNNVHRLSLVGCVGRIINDGWKMNY